MTHSTDTMPDTKTIPSPPEQEDAFAPAHEIDAPNSSVGMYELADRYLAWRNYKSMLADLTKDANEIIAKLEGKLSEQMIEEEVPKFTRGEKTFFLQTKTYASCKAGAKDALIEWLEEKGHASLVGQTVNANTLASFVKELLDDDANPTGELPDGLDELVNVHRTPTVQMRKA